MEAYSKTDIETMQNCLMGVARVREQRERIASLFAYPSIDEGGKSERHAFVEFGGGSAHTKISEFTRDEMHAISATINDILAVREANHAALFDKISMQRAK